MTSLRLCLVGAGNMGGAMLGGWLTAGHDPAAIEVIDPRFKEYVLGSAAIERLWTGARWAEGPVWFG